MTKIELKFALMEFIVQKKREVENVTIWHLLSKKSGAKTDSNVVKGEI